MAGYRYFEIARNKSNKTVGLYSKGRNFNIAADNLTKSEKLMYGVSEWASFYRARPDMFAEDYLGISLKPFQKIILYCMMHYNYSMFLASRGLGKTWLTALYCVVRCILYPDTKIVVVGGVKSQAIKIISEKIPELMSKSTTGTIERELVGSISTAINSDEPNVKFLNGSWIKIVPATQNARSGRANILVLDEFRMIDPSIYRNVLRRFLAVQRQPGYLSLPEYKNNTEFQERNQEIFLSSCYYKYNWSYSRYKVFYNSMLQGKGYFVCGLPYQFAIKEGLTSKEQLIDEIQEEDRDEIGFEMEMKCTFVGESQKAYYKFDEIQKCRTILKPIIPITSHEYIQYKGDKKKLNFYRTKEKNEIRILAVDLALIGKKVNDATVMTLISGIRSGRSYHKSVEFIDTTEGGNTEKQAFKIKQLFYDLECDYCVLDTQGNGIGVYDLCTKITSDDERNLTYPAWCAMNDEEKNIVRSIDKDALPVVYSVKTAGGNAGAVLHDMYTYAKGQFERKKIRLLTNELEARDYLTENYNLIKMNSEEQAKLIVPYFQVTRLVTELTNLESEIRSGFIKLIEPPGKRKDRAMSLIYGLYYFKILESELKQKDTRSDLEILSEYTYFV
jgi:hypothetical protein